MKNKLTIGDDYEFGFKEKPLFTNLTKVYKIRKTAPFYKKFWDKVKGECKYTQNGNHSYQQIEDNIVCVHCKDELLSFSIITPMEMKLKFISKMMPEIDKYQSKQSWVTVWHNGYHVIGYGACEIIIDVKKNTIVLPYNTKPNGKREKDG